MGQAKQVLIIAYLFPPIGGGGVHRAVKMARYLGDFGWKVHVLTVEPQYHATLDASLLAEIPDDVVIHRSREDQGLLNKLRPKPPGANVGKTESKEAAQRKSGMRGAGSSASASAESRSGPGAGEPPVPARPSSVQKLKRGIFQVLKKAKDLALIPDDQILWYPAAKKLGLKIIREHGIDAIFSTSGPYTNHLVARYLKRKTGLPWIADFRDPWTQNMHRSDFRLRNRIEERLERSVHREADMTLTVTHSFARDFNEKFGAAISRLEVIHNGYDPADYVELEHVQRDSADADRCVFMYAGIFYQERNPRLLLRAVKELIDEGKVDRQRILLRFAGVFDYPGYSDNIDAVRELELTDVVDIVGHLPHKQALAAMKRADVLLLVGDTAPESGSYIPGKLYEYLAIGHPILALSVPGESTNIIEKFALGEVADPQSVDAIKQAVRKLYEEWKLRQEEPLREPSDALDGSEAAAQPGSESSSPQSTLIYQRREQARMLAQLLNEITGSRR